MLMTTNRTTAFKPMNRAYNGVFRPGELSLGLVVPIENYDSKPVPGMQRHLERAQLAEALGFSAIWLRDVPFNVPSFGDAGQIFDPFVYLGALAASTTRIALGVASIVLPLRHPAHVAKAAASVDQLSGGRLLLGIASGDRPEEFPALGIPYENRGERFRDSYEYLRKMDDHTPGFENSFGRVDRGMDLLPKPFSGEVPLLITGLSQQSPEWLTLHGDGWMTYPRPAVAQRRLIAEYRDRLSEAKLADKPVMEPLYIDLVRDPDASPTPIHLGYRLGVNALRAYLESRRDIGVNHVALNLRFNQSGTENALRQLGDALLPAFSPENHAHD